MFVPMSCASSLSSSLSSTRALQYKYKWPIHQWYNADLPAKDQCVETDTCDPDRFNAGFTVHATRGQVFQQWRLQGHAASRRAHRLSAPYQAEVT